MSDAMKRCRMTVFRPARRKHYVMRWTDPITEQRHEESTKQARKRDAYEVAGAKAESVVSTIPTGAMLWDDFITRYEALVIHKKLGRAQEPWVTTKMWVAEFGSPKHLAEITTAWVTDFQDFLEKKGLAINTVASYSARLRAALRWAVDQELIPKAPKVRVKIEEAPRSRAIVLEEFERILAVIPKTRPEDWANWDRLLRGQWHSGLRISEIWRLSWDLGAPLHMDDSGRFPVIVMDASVKGRKRKIAAITPEFWEVCCETPKKDRHGLVFPIPVPKGNMSLKRVVKMISKFGTLAGVVTNAETGKLATSHDTRRGFAVVMDGKGLTLPELQKWMGHSSIKTTLTYYRTAEADQLAAKLWTGKSGALGGAPQKEDTSVDESKKPKS